MNFEKCVQFLKENFENIEIQKIEEEVNLYLIKKFETCENLNELNYEIDDNSLIELMEILSKFGNKKGNLSNFSTKRENKEKSFNEYLLNSFDNIKNEEDSSAEYGKFLNEEEQFCIDNQSILLKDNCYDSTTENNNEQNIEISHNINEKINYKNIKKIDNNNNSVIKENNYENMMDIMFSDSINMQKKDKSNNSEEEEKNQFIKNKENGNINKSLRKEAAEKKNTTILEILFSKSLLDNENIKQNIYAKKFYIINEDMFINIILILDRIILQLIVYYKEKKIEIEEQNSHFERFFNILYILLSNISFYSNEEKYRTIKLSNSKVKNYFLINSDIFNLVKLLFEILNFNTSYSNNLNKEDFQKLDVEIINPESCNLIWKFEKTFTDKDSILFEFVLSSIKIIMSIINKIASKKWITIEEGESINKMHMISKNENDRRLFLEQKKELEKISNRSTPINNKILQIHQKNKEEQQAINDIRKLHNERYKEHKVYGSNEKSDKNKNSWNKKIWESKENNKFSKDNLFLNEELDEKKKLKSKKKIKNFLKKLFKKN
ncbi:conserved Plasmodium protein, unknown function [Plasmodium relictum]|uniref:Uncharacterized protein n=1 Tax=Plasmodium relictum TaxID=85471 RepID=A0A1J1HF64_PLARL|nr:conserved Plasmodium protein, unknown function [Plasmodium relictum]CRH02509.1 conserved Plasmodium protein, unknown function [Plasmodium relictum]